MSKEMKTVNISRAMIDTQSLTASAENISANVEALAELDRRFNELKEAYRTSIQQDRLAESAKFQAIQARARAQQLHNEFLHFGGEHCRDIAEWSFWPLPPFKNPEGDIIIQTPISEDEVRKSAAVMHKTLSDQQDAALKPESGKDYSGMFGDEAGS